MTPGIDRRGFLFTVGATAGLAAAWPGPVGVAPTHVRAVGLKADYLDRPLGLENRRPRFSWRLESDERNVRQRAYRILVASSEAVLRAGRGDLWDSGKVRSRKSVGIQYGGRPLISRQRCWWQVRIWDERDGASALSVPSWWEMGLLEPQDWIAQWLAVEDPLAQADREAGLRWIWGAESHTPRSRKFRFRFQLPSATRAGGLYAVTHDWSWVTQLTGLWIDGARVAGNDWIERALIAPTAAPEPFSSWIALPSLNTGEHVLAIEVETRDLTFMANANLVRGLALLARFDLATGETLRLGSGLDWKTSLTEDAEWRQLSYDDQAWDAACPAPIEGYHPLPPTPAQYLRRQFTLNQPVRSARLYATALGAYEARLNGRRVGDALLTPEISQYATRALYQVYDVTDLLQAQENVLGLIVGDGWYASFDGRFAWGPPPRRVLAQLELSLADGSHLVIATGNEWRCAQSPILVSEIRVGEVYDARLEQPGWDAPAFDDAKWRDAPLGERPSCRLASQTSPAVRATMTLQPRAIMQPKPGMYVFDFGQNFAGWARLRTAGSRGTRITLEFAELLKPSGEIDQAYDSLGEPKRDVFILRGAKEGETFEPRFTYRGFRYVQVSGLPTSPTQDSLQGIVAHSDLEVTGRLRLDAPDLEQFWRNTLWTQRSNLVAIATDCPSREQRGWLADTAAFWDAATFNMDVSAFTARQMYNIIDDQRADGAFPGGAPFPRANVSFNHKPGGLPGWSEAGIIFPWMIWQRYGDTGIIEQYWGAMNRHIQFVLTHNPDYLWRKKRAQDLGEWMAVDRSTPKDLFATAYWAYSTELLAQMAEAIDRREDAARLRTLHERIRKAFNAAFVHPDGVVGSGNQTSYVLPLKFGLLTDSAKAVAIGRLVADIRGRGVSLSTGFFGARFVLDVLADAGFVDLVYGLLLRSEHPSWLHMVRNGATTVWESWSGDMNYEGKRYPLSQNHFAFGSVCGFLFRRVAGIDVGTPGFETILVRPVLDPRVRRGGGDYDSVIGRISTDWTQGSDGRFTLEVTIPANTTARIHLPARRESHIEEGGRAIAQSAELRLLERLDQEAVVEVGSGTYRFVVT